MYFSPVSLIELAKELRSGKLPLADYIDQTLARMGEVEPVIHSFLPENKRKTRLKSEAKALLKKYPDPEKRPLLFGVLVGVKDVMNVDKLPTRAGSKLPAHLFEGPEAGIVTILKNAGALILGKSVCTEFAYCNPGETRNPVNPNHTPGGSSSGSAAAVAAGISPLTIGTQIIASIIRPAAYCGIVGYKPSFDRVPNSWVFAMPQSMDQVGFMTSDIAGMELVASITVKNWHKTGNKMKPVFATPAEEFLKQTEPSAMRSFKITLDILKRAGYEIRSTRLLASYQLMNILHQDLLAAEFSNIHKDFIWEYGNLYSELAKTLYKKGLRIFGETVKRAKEQQMITRIEITEMMEREGIDIWITPAATRSAPSGIHSTGNPMMSLPWTFAGLPIVTIPSGKDRNGMPFGLQMVGPFGGDEDLLTHASKVESIIKAKNN